MVEENSQGIPNIKNGRAQIKGDTMKYRFLKDTSVKYGYWINQRMRVKEGQVVDLSSNIGDPYVKAKFAERVEETKVANKPTENKVAAPKTENKFTLGEKRAFGWFDILDSEGNVVEKAKGEEAAKEKLKELNG